MANGTRTTVVVVEDDCGMRSALTRVLGIAGFEVEAFTTAEDGLASGMAARADCIVCDVHLPGDSGLELGRRLAHARSKVPVIFITAHDSPAARAEAERLGAAAYLPKPFEGRALVDAVRAATRSS
ncbi:MAG: response regulator [Burkholderiales bacterium]|nr:response regulator [Burkholderiales bacterium]